MLIYRYCLQPDSGSFYMSLIAEALENGGFLTLDAAIAYATTRGVTELLAIIRNAPPLQMRWLIGVDWCRSHPQALSRLAALCQSEVRIHDGAHVVARRGCTPRVPFHPKSWILRGTGELAVVVGSGNLSGTGLTRGYEHGSLLMVRRPRSAAERSLWEAMRSVCEWFDAAWPKATPYAAIQDAYAGRYSDFVPGPVPTDDDATDAPSTGAGGADPERVRQLRAATHLWIEAGTLSRNRGPDRPGNQLDMSAMSRVFFDFSARAVPRNTVLGPVRMCFAGVMFEENMRFGDNHMDKLNLPVPGGGGPDTYDARTLLFMRKLDDEGFYFELVVGDDGPTADWIATSEAAGTRYEMRSGRRWGVF